MSSARLQEREDAIKADRGRLYVARIHFPHDDKLRHVIVKLRSINNGAAFEFIDPMTDVIVGSVGRNNLVEATTPIDRWLEIVRA